MRAAISKAMVGLAAMTLAVSMARPVSAGAITYLALGDSVAFGETTSPSAPTYGDRGYVGLVADKLSANYGGVRPNVVNLAVSGETTTSFFGGGTQSAPLNLNYANTITSQNTTMISQIAAQKAAGNTIGAVSVQLGANDLFALTNSSSFWAMNPSQQQSAILGAMSTVQNNYTAILTEIKALAPTADITLVGYYNPFPAIPDSPVLIIAAPAVQLLNAVIAGQAAAFGAKYVDTYTPFLGKEAEYTYASVNGNIHPNAAGYAAIANGFNTVPEPTTMALMATLGIGLIGRAARRRKMASAA